MSTLDDVIAFLNKLEESKIYYRLNKTRDSIMVEIVVPGQRWEVEFMAEGTIEIEKFFTENIIHDEREFETLFKNFSD